jgi:hypothetical protein
VFIVAAMAVMNRLSSVTHRDSPKVSGASRLAYCRRLRLRPNDRYE